LWFWNDVKSPFGENGVAGGMSLIVTRSRQVDLRQPPSTVSLAKPRSELSSAVTPPALNRE